MGVCIYVILAQLFCCHCLVAKSFPILFNPVDCSLPGSSVCGISQARILEWVVILFSKGSPWPRNWTPVSCIGASLVVLVVKNLPANAPDVRDLSSISGLGRSPGGGYGNPLQYSCQENPHGQRSPVGCSPWGHRVGHDWTTKHSTAHTIQSIHRSPSQPKRCGLSSFAYSFTPISNPSFTYSFTSKIFSEYLVGDKPLLSAKDM